MPNVQGYNVVYMWGILVYIGGGLVFHHVLHSMIYLEQTAKGTVRISTMGHG